MVRPRAHTSINDLIAAIHGATRAIRAAVAMKDKENERTHSADLDRHLVDLKRMTCLTFRITFDIFELHSDVVHGDAERLRFQQTLVHKGTHTQQVTFRDTTHMMQAMATYAAMEHRLRNVAGWHCPLLENETPFHHRCENSFGPKTRVVITAVEPLHGC